MRTVAHDDGLQIDLLNVHYEATVTMELVNLPESPYPLFERWQRGAEASEEIMYAAAACLSTATAEGGPDGRMVMVQEWDAAGFAFCTDERSAKARALAQEPRAGLTFYWGPLERQVRVRGRAVEAPVEEADRYFARRPRRSQVTAWASPQSEPVASRKELLREMDRMEERFAGETEIPRPSHWKAYRLRPKQIEFWQARAKRLHDRFRYEREGEAWSVRRLAP